MLTGYIMIVVIPESPELGNHCFKCQIAPPKASFSISFVYFKFGKENQLYQNKQ